MDSVDMKQEALGYVGQGVYVFPVLKNDNYPFGSRHDTASTDIEQVEKYWKMNPKLNIGIETGSRSGLVVLRFKNIDAFNEVETYGLPITPIAKAGRGIDVYFKYQDDVAEQFDQDRFPGVALHGDDMYVLAPPSVVLPQSTAPIEKADVYSWFEGKSLADVSLAEMPDWLFKKQTSQDTLVTDPVVVEVDVVDVVDQVEEFMEPRQQVVAEEVNSDPLNVVAAEILVAVVKEQDVNDLPSTDIKPGPVVGEWKRPVLFDKHHVEEIKADLLPSWLGAYAKAVCDSKQTPEGLAVMLGLSMIATGVQKKFVVAPYGDDAYTEQLALWTLTVMNSGERKSPILNAMRAPLVAWQKEQAVLLRDRILETKTEISVSEKRIEKLHKDAATEDDSEKRQALMDQITAIRRAMPVEVKAPVLWTSDVTAEELQDMLAEHGERMALLSAEGNIFEVMGGLYSDKVNVDIFLQAYSGEPTSINRRSRKAELDSPALTFGMAVQPSVIESFARGGKSAFRGKGALARFLYCVPESMVGYRDTDLDIRVPREIKARYEAGVKRLLSMPTPNTPQMLTLDDDAFKVYKDLDRKNEKMMVAGGELELMSDWGGKLPGNALRIAGLMHLVEHDLESTVISMDTMVKAVRLCDLLVEHAKAAFAMAGEYKYDADAKKAYEWIKEHGFKPFTKTAFGEKFKNSKKDQLDSMLSDLMKRNIIKELVVKTSGKSATNYISNPHLMQ